MKLVELVIRNFRGYRTEQRIPISDLTAFVGRNDSGKSSLLEALGIFLQAPGCDLDADDFCVHNPGAQVEIGCVFSDLPMELILDATSRTSLHSEYLLREDGTLELRQRWSLPPSRKPKQLDPVAFARHPSSSECKDLLLLKNQELKERAKSLGVDLTNVDARINNQLRKAIWGSVSSLDLRDQEVSLAEGDGKAIWDQLAKSLPVFALFRADRSSTDEDDEVQDPMKVAVRQALAEAGQKLAEVKDLVEEKALEVARRTLEKLKELENIEASTLDPQFRAEPKWESIFKLSLTSDDQVPLNKRGSGFRRLVLISFFRAEAERRLAASDSRSLIYAVEEPEVSQHPNIQRMLVKTFRDLASSRGCQVLLTTHVPGLAGLLPTEALRYLETCQDKSIRVVPGSDDIYKTIADSLGVIPDHRIRVIFFVEGPNDESCLQHLCRVLRASDATLPDIENDPRILILPLGGSNLRYWVTRHYFKDLKIPEVHLYDRGRDPKPKFQDQFDQVNARSDGSKAFLTSRAELENYLHPDAIRREFQCSIRVENSNDVPALVATAVYEAAPDSAGSWASLDDETRKKKMQNAKRRLNDQVASFMTKDQLDELGVTQEITSWLKCIKGILGPD